MEDIESVVKFVSYGLKLVGDPGGEESYVIHQQGELCHYYNGN